MAILLYDAAWIDQTLDRLAGEIAVRRGGAAPTALVGLRTRGAVLADRLAARLSRRRRDVKMPVGYLDATLYRDDLHAGGGLSRIAQPTDLPFAIDGQELVLVDDVVSTGRSVRAAMTALFDYGRPASIRLCAFLDRGGRQLPIQPDFTGARVEVPPGGFVRLKLRESDDREDSVYLVGPGDAEP